MEDLRITDLFGDKESNSNVNEAKLEETKTNSEILDLIMLRLVKRLQQSELAFKGGYILNKLLDGEGRLTHDIDFSIKDKVYYEEIKKVLKDIGEELKENKIIETYTIKEDIEETKSGGIKFKTVNGDSCGVDVGLHQLYLGVCKSKIDVGEICHFKIERMLADKIQAIYTKKRFRRVKDMYDVFCIINKFNVNYKLLSECLVARGEIDWKKSPIRDDIYAQYAHAWEKLTIRPYDESKDINLIKPPIGDVMQIFTVFILPLIENNNDSEILWDPIKGRWTEDVNK